jgi:hypothetical protein
MEPAAAEQRKVYQGGGGMIWKFYLWIHNTVVNLTELKFIMYTVTVTEAGPTTHCGSVTRL